MEQPFEAPAQDKLLISALAQEDRVAFYKKTYSHVALGVLVFIAFEYLLLQSDAIVEFALSMTQGYKWLIMLGGFMFVTNYAEKMTLKTPDKTKQYLAYGLYILAQAFIFIPMIYIAMFYMESGPELLQQFISLTKANS